MGVIIYDSKGSKRRTDLGKNFKIPKITLQEQRSIARDILRSDELVRRQTIIASCPLTLAVGTCIHCGGSVIYESRYSDTATRSQLFGDGHRPQYTETHRSASCNKCHTSFNKDAEIFRSKIHAWRTRELTLPKNWKPSDSFDPYML